MVTITVEPTGHIGNLDKLTKETVQQGMKLTAQHMLNELQSRSPVDHGLLKQWAVVKQSDEEIVIRSPAKYAAYQNYGTKAHMIRPKSKSVLYWFEGVSLTHSMFYAGGKMHTKSTGAFSKGHMVSGIKGKHFVEKSIQATQARIGEFFSIKG